MMMNGCQSKTSEFQPDNFPIGLVILSLEPKVELFNLISINKFALKLFNICPTSSEIFHEFIKRAKAFKQYFFNMCSLKSLYDSLLHLKYSDNQSISQYSNFILNGEIISVKMKRKRTEIFITIDDFSEEKKSIRKKLIASIRKNFLMTINHELKNYLCGVITTLEETKSKIDIKDFTTITATVLLIQKIIKLYTLFTKVSFDEIICLSLKLEENIDLYLIALKVQSKFKEIFLYKNIEMCSIDPFKKIFVKTDYCYMKNLMFVLFFYLYYKVSDNAVIEMDIEYPSASSCIVSFSNENNYHSSLNVKEVTFDDEVKMNEVQVKNSVMTVDILKYILEEIGKHLNISIEIAQPPPPFSRMNKMSSKGGNKKLLTLVFNDIEINDKATYRNADIDLLELKESKKRGNKMEFINKHITYSNPNYSVIEFPFEKKNTYDRFQLYVNKPKSSYQNVLVMTKSDKDNRNTNISSNYLGLPNKYEKVLTAFRDNQRLFDDNSRNGKGKKDYNFVQSAKFKSDSFLVNVDFESDADSANENDININNNDDSSNIDEDDMVTINHQINGTPTNSLPVKTPPTISINNMNNHTVPYIPKSQIRRQLSCPKKYLRSKKVANTSTFNHTFTPEETTIYSGSIGQKISHLVASEDSIKRILDDITEEEATEEKAKESNCDCRDIVVVDDESSIARSMMKILHNQNYEADYCKDGKDCIEKVLSKLICLCSKRYYKLILLDVYMNDWGGIATCHKINELIGNKTIPPTMNVVFISGHKLKDLDLPNYSFIKGFYQKPVNKSTIIKILHQYYY